MINNSFNKRYKKLPIATSESVNCDTEVHNHSEFEILYIEKGSSEVTVSGKTFIANPPKIIKTIEITTAKRGRLIKNSENMRYSPILYFFYNIKLKFSTLFYFVNII